MTISKTNKYLQFINFSRCFRWDVKAYAFQHREFDNAVLLQDILTPYDVPLSKAEMVENGWSIISKINFSGKLFLRKPEETESFKGSVHKVDGNTLIYSKINVRHGCVYYHPNNATPFAVSSEYPAYKIDKKRVNGEFLVLLLQSQYFKDALSARTSGISKARVKPSVFLTVEVPLPSLEEQNEIVAAYNNSLALADEYEQKAIKEEEKGKQYISTQLGFTTINSDSSTPALLMYFKKLSELSVRWDVWNIAQSCYNGEYELISLSKVIRMSSGQFLPTKAQIEGPYNVYGGNGKTGTHNKYCYSGKRIVIGRVGEYCGNVHLVDGDYWITDNALKVDKIYDGITWEFLAVALESLNINQYKSISAQPSISQSKILQLQIPLPPLELQNEIVEHITFLREKQKAMIEQAKEHRLQAKQQFEQIIFEKI